jgi:hypothetical protein
LKVESPESGGERKVRVEKREIGKLSGAGGAGAFINGDLKQDGAREGFGDNSALGGEEIGLAGVPFSRAA